MERTCKFYKEASGNWYIDLPEWEGGKDALQMVLGADTFLDILSQGQGTIDLRFADEEFNGADKLTWVCDGVFDMEEVGGAVYRINKYKGIDYDFNIWLCDVTAFIFGNMPKEIYFAVVSEV